MTIFVRVDHAERRICEIATAACRRRTVRALFRSVSRLGDGVIWYVLMAVMPLIMGLDRLEEGLRVSLQMLAAGAFGLALYKLLKKKLVRERPYISSQRSRSITCRRSRSYSCPSRC